MLKLAKFLRKIESPEVKHKHPSKLARLERNLDAINSLFNSLLSPISLLPIIGNDVKGTPICQKVGAASHEALSFKRNFCFRGGLFRL